MTSAQVVEMLVTKNSSSQNYPHTIQTTDTPGFKPFTTIIILLGTQEQVVLSNLSYCVIDMQYLYKVIHVIKFIILFYVASHYIDFVCHTL